MHDVPSLCVTHTFLYLPTSCHYKPSFHLTPRPSNSANGSLQINVHISEGNNSCSCLQNNTELLSSRSSFNVCTYKHLTALLHVNNHSFRLSIFHKLIGNKYLKMHVVTVIVLTIKFSLLLQMYVLLCRLLLNVQISSCFLCQWPRGIRRGSAGVGLLGLWFQSHWKHVFLSLESVVFCQVEVFRRADHSSRESYRLYFVWVWQRSLDNEQALAHQRLLCFGGGGNRVCKQRNA